MPKQASKIQYVLREKDIDKVAEVFGVDVAYLRMFNDKRMLNVDYIRDRLIKYDYHKLTNGLRFLVDENKTYTYPEITAAICNNYNISKKAFNQIINSKINDNAVFCQRCGIRVSKQQYTKTNGLCENCFAMTIDL